jgi:hypothetical protein
MPESIGVAWQWARRFRALGPRESGIKIYGEQRGSAVAEF